MSTPLPRGPERTSRKSRFGRHLSSAKNRVSWGSQVSGGLVVSADSIGIEASLSSSSSILISSGFSIGCGEGCGGGCDGVRSSSSTSSSTISSGLSERLDLLPSPPPPLLASCLYIASNFVCRCALNHHRGLIFLRTSSKGGDPSVPVCASCRKNGLRRNRLCKFPCCSMVLGQSWDKKISGEES